MQVHLLDATYELFRAHFAPRPQRLDPNGQPVGATVGVLENALYLLPESIINVEFYDTEPVGIHLPQTVDLKVRDTAPGIKGATASAQTKPATCETGFVITVPSFINPGDVVRINTESGEYQGRA